MGEGDFIVHGFLVFSAFRTGLVRVEPCRKSHDYVVTSPRSKSRKYQDPIYCRPPSHQCLHAYRKTHNYSANPYRPGTQQHSHLRIAEHNPRHSVKAVGASATAASDRLAEAPARPTKTPVGALGELVKTCTAASEELYPRA